jgi:hypothetical protein
MNLTFSEYTVDGDEKSVQTFIRENIVVKPEMVEIAKAIILRRIKGNTTSTALLEIVVSEQSKVCPETLRFGADVDSVPDLKSYADTFSWRLAGAEAVLSMTHAGSIVPTQETFTTIKVQCSYRTKSYKHAKPIELVEYQVAIPVEVRLATSFAGKPDHTSQS